MAFFQYSFLLLLSFSTMSNQTSCECTHINIETKCSNSAKCIWNKNDEKCQQNILFQNIQGQISYCSQFPEDECIENIKCAFHLGKCIEFTQCSDYLKERCTQTSKQCVSNGLICIKKAKCNEYENQISCSNLNEQNKYCIWKNSGDFPKCQNIEKCKDLPSQISTDSECRNQLNYCTVSEQGGCMDQLSQCSQYKFAEQCKQTSNNVICFWENIKDTCFDKICINKQLSTYEECENFSKECTSNGETCINKTSCNNYENQISCSKDHLGNKCVYFQQECYSKSCSNAPKSCQKIEQCQIFGQECVPLKLGGCKIIPQSCDQLETEDSCFLIGSINGIKCFWKSDQNICKEKQCQDAPMNFNHQQCITWLKEYQCIGGNRGGCMQNVDNCNQIQNILSCVQDKFKKKCIIENNQCVEEACENLKYPYYNNDEECEQKLTICAYDVFKKSCTNKECSNLNSNLCNFDYNLKKCIVPPGCQHKTCESASLLFNTYDQCQLWDAKCTINVVIAAGITYQNGCLTKFLDCSQFQYQQQCITSLQGIPCYWNDILQKCEFHNCENAPLSINTIIQCKQWIQYHNLQCILKENGGCILQKDSCDKLTDQLQCTQGSTQKQCYWDSVNKLCIDRTCENASITLNSNLLCRQWLSTCILHDSGNGCKLDSGIYQLCTDAPDTPNFSTVEECQAWNPKCTLKFGVGCSPTKECNQYTTAIECQVDIYDQRCTWDGTICQQKKCSQYPGIPTINNDCYYYSTSCTIKINQVTCIAKQNLCSDYNNQYDCLVNSQGNKCIFDTSSNTCNDALNFNRYYLYDEYQCLSTQKSNQFNYYFDNHTCNQRPNLCSEVIDQVICDKISTLQDKICKWNSLTITCEEAQQITQISVCTQLFYYTQANCLKFSSNCQLDISRATCQYKDCTTILTQIECSTIILDNIIQCIWRNNSCVERACDNFIGYDITVNDCIKWIDVCTLNTGNPSCILRTSCSQETNELICNQSSYLNAGTKISCFWNGTQCIEITNCNQISNSLSYFECNKKLQTCVSQTIAAIQNSCQEIPKLCSYLSQENCIRNSQGQQCSWNYNLNQCIVVACKRFYPPYRPPSQQKQLCQSLGPQCIFIAERRMCDNIIDCSTASQNPSQYNCYNYNRYCYLDENYEFCKLNQKCTDSTTYQFSCEYFVLNKKCTYKEFKQSCQPFAQYCGYYNQVTCLHDYKQNQCYWSQSVGDCYEFYCGIVEESVMTHQDCQAYSKSCTINITNGFISSCKYLEPNCENYLYQEQCYIDFTNNLCIWIDNTCKFNNCGMAPINVYTIDQCEQQIGSNCTINQDRSGCVFKQKNCNGYNKFQCLSPGIKNELDIECFWSQTIQSCNEKLCENAPSNSQNLQQCESFHQNCETTKCRKAICGDFRFKTDLQCSIVMPNNECTSNGNFCIQRKQCENASNEISCTFSNDFKDCQWIEDQNRCATKSCDTAPLSLQTNLECQTYLPECTNKKNGGCLIFSTCNLIQSEEACIIDINNETCIWNSELEQCVFLTCNTICGDGVVGENEQCDDANLQPYDGCYKCKIQCQLGCVSCEQNKCFECNQGYDLNKEGQCTEQCGDGIIIGREECDDMNNEQFDGCFQCKFQCHQACQLCALGVCQQCSYGWEEYQNQCRSVCGNGLVVSELEECDDGNNDNFDGCNSKCQEEEDWICIESSITGISECKNLIHPKIILENLSYKKDSEQIIQVSFDQELKLISPINLEEYFKLNITNNCTFSYYIKTIQQPNLYLSQILYKFYITITDQVDAPHVTISLNQSVLLNAQNLELSHLSANIGLGTPLVLSMSAQQKLNSTIAFNEIMIYTFIGSSCISVITGNFELFFNMLALLQQLSYVRYLNIPYPTHLQQYLKVFKVVSFQPLYDKLNIDEYFKKLNFGKSPFIQSKHSNPQTEDENNAFFLVNAKSFYITMLTSFSVYILARIIISLQKKISAYLLKQKNYLKLNKFYKLSISLKQFAVQTSNYFIYSGLIKVFISTEYQLLYSTYSQFPNYKFSFEIEDAFEMFNSLNALSALIFSHIFIFYFIVILKRQFKTSKNKFSIFYENVKSEYWSRFFIPFSMIKVSIYMAIIAFQYDSPVIQVISLTILNNIFCYYLIFVQPLKSKTEYFKIIQREITFTIIVAGFFPYSLDIQDNIINILGWIHIGLFSSIIGSNIVIDGYKQSQELWAKYQKNKILQQKKRENLYHTNQLTKFIQANYHNNGLNNNITVGFDEQTYQ